ncbi:quinone-dependent dihydroorotate dehydrogenase [Acetobacter estunensis]|uniref:quinone-dependent dihydroorotate dehydrogenase n=1 Tax=Acetobacter estunensis TaxID=104097 RepID=UPI001C2D4E1C|nr:quinone-dependent dihydroorotate dehydrogenase [Acetobacter estunensis]MBV1838655.1 quinone-dependent dihydroorotate dehydrogenase [Acetobacter estunensis]
MTDITSSLLPLVRKLDPEQAHRLAIEALSLGVGIPVARPKDDPALAVRTLGMRFPNPIGMAAGFDKDARVLRPLARLGFGFVEAGTVTPRPQPGNPQPRLFRLDEDRAVINRMGFNNQGIDRFAVRLAHLHRGKGFHPGVPVGANLGINKVGAVPERDYPDLIRRVKHYVDYIVLNLSSPNTPGLRALQGAERLTELLGAISAAHATRPPLLIKLAPDLSEDEIGPIVEAAIAGGAQGLIISNTTLARPADLKSRFASEAGGLSGRPLKSRALSLLRDVARLVNGRIALIGCGGIETGADVIARICAGADLVQVYTAFAYDGPALLPRLKREMQTILCEEGIETIADLKGADL